MKRERNEYLNEIAEKYYDDIYYFCAYQTGSREDAYDLAQETFLRFFRYLGTYRKGNLKGYLLTIAMNVCRNYFAAENKVQKNEVFNGEFPVASVDGWDGLEKHEQSVALKEALSQLPAIQREAVILHHLYGFSSREIMKMTGVSHAAVKSRISQGLGRLRGILRKEDFYG